MATSAPSKAAAADAVRYALEKLGYDRLSDALWKLQTTLMEIDWGFEATLTIKPETLRLSLKIAPLPERDMPLLDDPGPSQDAREQLKADMARQFPDTEIHWSTTHDDPD